MARFDDLNMFANVRDERPALDPAADLQSVLDSLVSRLDAVQRQAFYEKMAQLDRRDRPAGGRAAPRAPLRSPGWLS